MEDSEEKIEQPSPCNADMTMDSPEKSNQADNSSGEKNTDSPLIDVETENHGKTLELEKNPKHTIESAGKDSSDETDQQPKENE